MTTSDKSNCARDGDGIVSAYWNAFLSSMWTRNARFDIAIAHGAAPRMEVLETARKLRYTCRFTTPRYIVALLRCVLHGLYARTRACDIVRSCWSKRRFSRAGLVWKGSPLMMGCRQKEIDGDAVHTRTRHKRYRSWICKEKLMQIWLFKKLLYVKFPFFLSLLLLDLRIIGCLLPDIFKTDKKCFFLEGIV